MKNFLEEFRKFLNRGNALELAIGVIIGSSFSGIVNSLVNDIIMPIIGRLIGGFDFSNIQIKLGGDSNILIGSFIPNVVNFVIVAFVLFCVIRSTNKLNELKKKKESPVEEKPVEDPEDIKLLKSIDNELKKLNNK